MAETVTLTPAELTERRQHYGELLTQQRAILDAAKAEKRELTADENQTYESIETDLARVESEIAAAEEAGRGANRERRLAEREQAAKEHRSSEPIRPGVQRTERRAAIAEELRDIMSPDELRRWEAIGSPEYRSAFRRKLMLGESALSAAEVRALSVGTATEGGNTVPTEEFRPELIKAIDNAAVIRPLARVFTVTMAQSLGAPTLSADPADPAWTSELLIGSEDSTMAFGKREMIPNPLAKYIKVSKKWLRATPVGGEALVRDRLGYKQGVAQSTGFNTGTGATQALGIYTASASGISTSREVEIGNGSGAVDADKLITARYTLRQGYAMAPTARWHMHRLWLAKFRKLKATTGDYVWQPGLSRGDPVGMTLLDVPVVLDEYAPSTTTHGAGVYGAVLGDFQFYWIVEALGIEVQRLDELFAATNQVGFIIRTEVDGMPVLEDAFVRCLAAT